MIKKVFLPVWIFASVLIFLYSYTQVDLSLTLSKASVFQAIEKGFQYIGWFNRPLSAFIYVGLITCLFLLFFWTLRNVWSGKLQNVIVIKTVLIISLILGFSYNAFSYDLFNYIFDAKIVTFYNQDPFLHKPLDFPNDPMLSFMHWTHRTYPYGPTWLLLTVPISYLGGNIFLLTFFFFKFIAVGAYLLSVMYIIKIAKQLEYKNYIFPAVFFAFNPLILIEVLVSAHNDIVMLALALVSISLLLEKKKIYSYIFLVFSILIKFGTVFLLPVYIFNLIFPDYKSKQIFIYIPILLMIIPIFLATLRTTFQPWYLLYIITFGSLGNHKKFILYPLILISVLGLINYLPFIYFGVYEGFANSLIDFINLSILVLGSLLFCILYFYDRIVRVKNKSIRIA